MKLLNFKRYEIVKLLDKHMMHFRFENNKVIEENYYELDVIYFGFWRTGWYLKDGKDESGIVLRGKRLRRTLHRGILSDFIQKVYSWDWGQIHPGYQSMYLRETFCVFRNKKELRDKFPEYFI